MDSTVEQQHLSMVIRQAEAIPRVTASDGKSGDNRTGVIFALILNNRFLGSTGTTGYCLGRR